MVYAMLIRGRTDKEIADIDTWLSGRNPGEDADRRGEGVEAYEQQQAALALLSGAPS